MYSNEDSAEYERTQPLGQLIFPHGEKGRCRPTGGCHGDRRTHGLCATPGNPQLESSIPGIPKADRRVRQIDPLVLARCRGVASDDWAIAELNFRAAVGRSLGGCRSFHLVSDGSAVVTLASISREADLHGGTN